MLWVLALIATVTFLATGAVPIAALCIMLYVWAAFRDHETA